MRRDAQQVRQVEDALNEKHSPIAMEMEVSITSKRVGGPDAMLPLTDLERNMEIARARYLTALENVRYWQAESRKREGEFSNATIVYNRRKYNLTDDDLEGSWSQDVHGVFEKKKEKL